MATGYITGHQHRSSASLLVYYYVDGVRNSVDVPITPRSVRRFQLMQDDYMQLEFSLAEPINFGIGSYFIDPIFGGFYVITEQMPRYNKTTGGYDYSLRFDAPYMRWKNFLHCLVSGNRRMETTWSLTDKLAIHAQQIADNVNIIFPQTVSDIDPDTQQRTSTGYAIDVDAANAAEIKHLQYNGKDIISAMNDIAEKYGCEWWVDDERTTVGNTVYLHTIHFGKCELDNTPFEFEVGDNMESMDISRDQQTFANRIYAYGGTQNVPEDYDKQLLFYASTYNATTGKFIDSDRQLTLDMIDVQGSTPVTAITIPAAVEDQLSANPKKYIHTASVSLSGSQTFDLNLICRLQMNGDWSATDIPTVSLTAQLKYGDNTILVPTTQSVGIGIGIWYYDINYRREVALGSSNVTVQLVLTWSITFAQGSTHTGDTVSTEITGTATATADAASATKDLYLYFNGTRYDVQFNGADGYLYFTGSKPTRTAFLHKNFTLSPLDLLKIPLSWYTRDYDTGTMRMAGEKRIHLPVSDYPNRYIDAQNTQGTSPVMSQVMSNESQVVEAAVVWPDVYPKLTLRIKAGTLVGTPRQQKVEHSDGSVTYEDWTQWSFKAEYKNGNTWLDFNFRTKYMLDGAKLQAVFSTPQTAQNSGWMLSGMTFDLGFDERDFTIIRNEDYGVKLPNEVLIPTVGDEFVLTGWNPRAMNELGIVTAAEDELASKAEQYLSAIQEGQFTFNCHMMSNIFWVYAYGGRDADGNTPKTYGLLDLGAKVTIVDSALPGGSKTSRIIGYEYKMDIPYDTPTYIVGETEAFSRLKQIEKQLTKL